MIQGAIVCVDFYANWCKPCKAIAPTLDKMQQEYSEQNVVFLKVDVDELDIIAYNYKIDCMPTFLFFQDGNLLTKFEGASEENVRKNIDFLIQSRDGEEIEEDSDKEFQEALESSLKAGEEEQEAELAAALLASALESEKPETRDNELPLLEFRQVYP